MGLWTHERAPGDAARYPKNKSKLLNVRELRAFYHQWYPSKAPGFPPNRRRTRFWMSAQDIVNSETDDLPQPPETELSATSSHFLDLHSVVAH